MHPSAAPQDDLSVTRRPRDAQRTRLYLAETPMPSSPLPGLDACARFVDRVVGSMWWHLRFPDRNLAIVPRLRPGNGARQAFYREEETGPTITLPRRYRTKGVVLHELVHFALGLDSGLPHHGRTFARDPARRHRRVLRRRPREHPRRLVSRARRARRPRHRASGPTDNCGTGGTSASASDAGGSCTCPAPRPTANPSVVTGRFEGYERGSSIVRLSSTDGTITRVATASVWDVADA